MQTSVEARIKDTQLVETRRAQIIEAARRVFLEKGFHAATVREIGQAAGLTQGTLYNYVRTKEDILFLVCDSLVQAYQDAVERSVGREADPESRLRVAIRAVAQVMADHQDDLLVLYREAHAMVRPALRNVLGRVRQLIDYFARLIEEASAKGRLRCERPQVTANIVTFLPAIIALRRWDLRRHATDADVVESVVDFLVRGLGIDPNETAPVGATARARRRPGRPPGGKSRRPATRAGGR